MSMLLISVNIWKFTFKRIKDSISEYNQGNLITVYEDIFTFWEQ